MKLLSLMWLQGRNAGSSQRVLSPNPHPSAFKRSIQTKNIKTIYRSADYPNLVVLDKENGGKADALNAGINVSMYPVFVSIDADSILENSSLIKIVYTFMSDPNCIAVGGIIRIGSGCKL